MKVALFRWKALGPLLAVALLGGVAWWLFGDALGRRAFEAAGTAIIGAKVDVDRMHLALLRGKVELQGLTVASPSESLKNVLQANQLVADLDLLPLLEKKVVIDRLAATGMRFGTPRATSGIVQSSSPSLASQVKANVTDWAAHVDVPALQLTSGKVALPRLSAESLGAVRAVQSLGRQIDSSKAAWDTALASLHVQQTVDSAAAMANRLKGAKPTDLVLLNDARRTLTQVKATHDRVVAVERE